MSDHSGEVTALLHAWTAGDLAARDRLVLVVYLSPTTAEPCAAPSGAGGHYRRRWRARSATRATTV